ncbi:MAG: protein kinase [Myxococcales bacterium]|nr:protein kinase [Myxococcales bacterium]
MRYCPLCGESTEALHCPEDGTPTVRRVASATGRVMRGEVIGGRYRVIGVIGRGGFGTVYEAQHVTTGHSVAVKLLSQHPGTEGDELARRFFKEAATTSRLSHPNTVRVFDFGQTEGGDLFIAMERLVGESLQETLTRNHDQRQLMSEAQVVEIGVAVLRSLGEAHAHGLVHRDMKPANIFLHEVAGGDSIVKVLDFGIVKDVDASITQAGKALGTPTHMSPEQAMGKDVDSRCDLYALGCVLFECLTGGLPYFADNPLAIVMQHVTEPVPRIEDRVPGAVRPSIASVVERALAKEPSERWENASAMRAALQQALSAPGFGAFPLDPRTGGGVTTGTVPGVGLPTGPEASRRTTEPSSIAVPKTRSSRPSIRVRLPDHTVEPDERTVVERPAMLDTPSAIGAPPQPAKRSPRTVAPTRPPVPSSPPPPVPGAMLRPEAPVPASVRHDQARVELAERETVYLDSLDESQVETLKKRPPAIAVSSANVPVPEHLRSHGDNTTAIEVQAMDDEAVDGPSEPAPQPELRSWRDHAPLPPEPSSMDEARKRADAAAAVSGPAVAASEPAVAASEPAVAASEPAVAVSELADAASEPAVIADAASEPTEPIAEDDPVDGVIGAIPAESDVQLIPAEVLRPPRPGPRRVDSMRLGGIGARSGQTGGRPLPGFGSMRSSFDPRTMQDQISRDLMRMTASLRQRTQERSQQVSIGAMWISEDGRSVLYGDRDGRIGLVRGTEISERPVIISESPDCVVVGEHAAMISALAMSPDGRLVLAASVDGVLRAWAPVDGELLATLDIDASVNALDISVDGKLAIAGCDDGSARLIELPSLKERRSLRGHRDAVTAVAVAGSRRAVVTAGQGGTIRTWDPVGGGARLTSRGHQGAVSALALERRGKWVLSGGWNGQVRLWSPRTGETKQQIDAHTDVVAGVALDPTGALFATVSDDRSARIWDLETGAIVAERDDFTTGAKVVRFRADGRCIYIGAWDGSVRRLSAVGPL